MIHLLIYILIVCLVIGLILYLIQMIPMDARFRNIAYTVAVVIGILIVIFLLLDILPAGRPFRIGLASGALASISTPAAGHLPGLLSA